MPLNFQKLSYWHADSVPVQASKALLCGLFRTVAELAKPAGPLLLAENSKRWTYQ